MTIVLLIVSCAFFLLSGAMSAYFLIAVPRRWREPLAEALGLLDSDDRDKLENAERLLAEALNAGPRGLALSQARFAQVFVQAMLGRHDPDRFSAASAQLKELTGDGYDEVTAYLDLWLQSRMDNHDRVCDIWEKQQSLLKDRPRSRYIAAASHLHLAVEHWRRREVDGALHYFDVVRSLGELADKIPPGVDDLQLLRGIQMALDDRLDDARAAFTSARDRAARIEAPTIAATAGLLACDWQREAPAELRGRLEILYAKLDPPPPGDKETDMLRAPVALLRLVALLREWSGRPELAGAPGTADREELRGLADALRAADPESGDSFLIEGLIGYYFAAGEGERKDALSTLERGLHLAHGIMVPEIADLVERERSLGGEGDAISRYRALVGAFLADPARSDAQRAELREIATRFAPFGDPAEVPEDLEPQDLTPDMTRLRSAQALRNRIQLIVLPRIRDNPDDSSVRQLREKLDELDKVSDAVSTEMRDLHETEQSLVIHTGQILLPEEEG